MPTLESALASVPGLAGYKAEDQLNRGREAQDLNQALQFSTLQQHFSNLDRERKFREGLRPDMSPEELVAHASQYAAPKDVLTVTQHGLDRKAQIGATKEMALSRLSQAAASAAQTYELRLKTAGTAQERLALERNYKSYMANLSAEKARYDTGANIEPFTMPQGDASHPGGVDFNFNGTRGNVPDEAAALAVAQSMGITGSPPAASQAQPPQQPTPAPSVQPAPSTQAQDQAPTPSTEQDQRFPVPVGNLSDNDREMLRLQARGGVAPSGTAMLQPPGAPATQMPPQSAAPQQAVATASPVMPAFSGSPREQAHQRNVWLQSQARTTASQLAPLTGGDLVSAGAQVASGMPITQVIPGYRGNIGDRRESVRAEAIRQIKESNPGMTDAKAGQELANRGIDLAAGRKSVGQLTQMLGATRQAVDQLDFNVKKVTEEMDKLGSQGITNLSPVINAIARGEQKWTGEPAYSALYYYMFAAGQESARILSGGQASVAQLYQGAAEEARQWASANMTTPKAWKEGVAPAMLAEGRERLKTYERAIQKQRLGAQEPSDISTRAPAAAGPKKPSEMTNAELARRRAELTQQK